MAPREVGRCQNRKALRATEGREAKKLPCMSPQGCRCKDVQLREEAQRRKEDLQQTNKLVHHAFGQEEEEVNAQG